MRTEPPGDRPLGISLIIWMYWFWAGALGLLILTLVTGQGPVLLAGRSMVREDAVAALLPVLAPLALALVGAALALGQRRRWARVAALFPFVLAGFAPVLMVRGGTAGPVMAAPLPFLAALAWYLYRRPGPRTYFDQAGDGDRSGDDGRVGSRDGVEDGRAGGGGRTRHGGGTGTA